MKIFKTIIPGMMMASVAFAKDEDLEAELQQIVDDTVERAVEKKMSQDDIEDASEDADDWLKEFDAADLQKQEAVKTANNVADKADLEEEEADIYEDDWFEKMLGDATEEAEVVASFAAIEAEVEKNLPEDATEEQFMAAFDKAVKQANAQGSKKQEEVKAAIAEDQEAVNDEDAAVTATEEQIIAAIKQVYAQM